MFPVFGATAGSVRHGFKAQVAVIQWAVFLMTSRVWFQD